MKQFTVVSIHNRKAKDFALISNKISAFVYINVLVCTGLDRPWGIHKFQASRFQNNRRIKVVKLSALYNGRLYPPGNIPGIQFR